MVRRVVLGYLEEKGEVKVYLPLSRKNSKLVGLVLMALGFFLSTPPGFLTPDDFLNIYIASLITGFFGINKVTALVLTYTIIAWGLIIVGALVYPYNTRRLLRSKERKVVAIFKGMFSTPTRAFISLLAMFILFEVYKWFYAILS